MSYNELQKWLDELEGTRPYEGGYTEESVLNLLNRIFDQKQALHELNHKQFQEIGRLEKIILSTKEGYKNESE